MFCVALRFWQYAAAHCSLSRLVLMTFMLELALVVVVGLFTTTPGAALYHLEADSAMNAAAPVLTAALVIGAANGLYNAFFWTTQRALFLGQLGQNDTGRQYGNLQIYVSIILKLGILSGGLLLDHGGFAWLLAISAVVGAIAGYVLCSANESEPLLDGHTELVTLWQSLRFKDQRGTAGMFRIDGIFLYLESHFWTLSLFLVVQQDYSRLGIAVVVLALIFAAFFYIIKNRIDQLLISTVFRIAVWLYAASWIMRLGLNERSSGASLLIILIIITFCSSFFRLAFNKLFFDAACRTHSISYLLMKSYASQWVLGLFYLSQAAALWIFGIDTYMALSGIYAGAAMLSLIYLGYAKAGH